MCAAARAARGDLLSLYSCQPPDASAKYIHTPAPSCDTLDHRARAAVRAVVAALPRCADKSIITDTARGIAKSAPPALFRPASGDCPFKTAPIEGEVIYHRPARRARVSTDILSIGCAMSR
jgi:hypothetical protein